MDIVLDFVDEHLFTPYVYPKFLVPENIFRQLLSLTVIVVLGGYALYLIVAALGYYFIFDKRLLQHPQSLKVRNDSTRFYDADESDTRNLGNAWTLNSNTESE